jgi:hypothetical protein
MSLRPVKSRLFEALKTSGLADFPVNKKPVERSKYLFMGYNCDRMAVSEAV